MFTKKILFILVIVLSMASIISAQSKGTIVFVHYKGNIDPATGEYPDMPHIYALQNAGYEVILFYNGALTSASQATLDTLYTANLIVMGRSTPSLGYGDHKAAWNEISTPTLCLEMWACRSNRLNWFNTESIATYADSGTVYNAIIETPDDPVFEVLDDTVDTGNPVPWVVGPLDAMGISDAGNGIVLARMEETNNLLFVRFEPDVEFYDGAGDFPWGHRTVIGNGRDESSQPPFNYYNFTEESEAVFLAEVKRMVALGGFVDPVEDRENTTIPSTLVLSQNYPNPFNPTTTIAYSVTGNNHVTLSVFNVLGERMATLVNEMQTAGTYSVAFNGSNLSSGIYLYRIQSGRDIITKKMMLVK
jgi:hypothetical protein